MKDSTVEKLFWGTVLFIIFNAFVFVIATYLAIWTFNPIYLKVMLTNVLTITLTWLVNCTLQDI